MTHKYSKPEGKQKVKGKHLRQKAQLGGRTMQNALSLKRARKGERKGKNPDK